MRRAFWLPTALLLSSCSGGVPSCDGAEVTKHLQEMTRRFGIDDDLKGQYFEKHVGPNGDRSFAAIDKSWAEAEKLFGYSVVSIKDARATEVNNDARYAVCRGDLTAENPYIGRSSVTINYKVSRTTSNDTVLEYLK